MDTLKKSMDDLSAHFNARMAEFQQELRTSIPATSPNSNINAQFVSFRSFVLSALESVHLQIQTLAKQQEELEVRSRRKILLLHGVSEASKENIALCVSKLLSEQLNMPELSVETISRCHRLGQKTGEKDRVVLVKFKDLALRNKIWFSKSKFKGSGLTLSEFLIKSRHEVFMAARKKVGVSKCWTRDGEVIVLGANGTQHRLVSVTELNAIVSQTPIAPVPSTSVASSAASVTPAHSRPNVTIPVSSRNNKTIARSKPRRFVRK